MTLARAAATPPSRTPLLRRVAATLITGIVTALVVHLANIAIYMIGSLALFLQGTADVSIAGSVHSQFSPSTLFYLIALIVFGFIGVYTRWYFSLATGVVFGAAAVLGGTTIALGSSAGQVPLSTLFSTLLTTNFPFVLSAVLATLFVARPLFRALVRGRTFDSDAGTARRVALVRVPAENLAEGISSAAVVVDLDLANKQWDDYVSALLDNGWSTIEAPGAPTLADSVFVEDAAVIFGGTAVIANPGAESRAPEIAGAEHALRELGLTIERIEAPGTLEGGDVLKVGSTVYVGRSSRTNAEGVRQLRAILSDSGWTVIAVPVEKVLHLKSAVTALPDGTVIGDPSLIGDTSVFDRFLPAPEPGAEVVVLSEDTVLMAASAPKSQALVADLGYSVVSVDISEFEKLDGCVTCLSIRIR